MRLWGRSVTYLFNKTLLMAFVEIARIQQTKLKIKIAIMTGINFCWPQNTLKHFLPLVDTMRCILQTKCSRYPLLLDEVCRWCSLLPLEKALLSIPCCAMEDKKWRNTRQLWPIKVEEGEQEKQTCSSWFLES